MRKLLFFLVYFFLLTFKYVAAQQKDEPIEIKSFSIRIQSDMFVATTVMDIELYNPNAKVLDGEYSFSLNQGQVVTGFALDINGFMRQGVITDKQKARVAYENTIRRQIDPGLLEMTAGNNYRIRVYPMPANGTRKIKIVIAEQFSIKENALQYQLPLDIAYPVKQFDLFISAADLQEMPVSNDGLIGKMTFQRNNDSFFLRHTERNAELKQPISFKIGLPQTNKIICAKRVNNNVSFALHLKPQVQTSSVLSFSSATVFWDVSGSSSKRDMKKDIRFLENFISEKNITAITIVLFSNTIHDTKSFYGRTGMNSIRRFLQSQTFDGGTQLGSLDCNRFNSDVFFLFSDGLNNFRSDKIKTNDKPIYCVNSSPAANHSSLKSIAEKTGGRYVNLYASDADKEIKEFNTIRDKLMYIQAGGRKVLLNNSLPLLFDDWITVTGQINVDESSEISFYFGDAGKVMKTETININVTGNCDSADLATLSLLQQYEKLVKEENEQSIVSFAKQNKLVTTGTSFIVLDNLQDYIQYGIEPPADLKDEYNKMIYVIKQREEQQRTDEANAVVNNLRKSVSLYNERIRWWSKEEKLISLQVVELKAEERIVSAAKHNEDVVNNQNNPAVDREFKFGNNSLQEVVVIGYAAQRRRNVTGAVTTVQGSELSSGALNVQQALEGRVAGLSVVRDNNSPGAAPKIFIRGAGTLGNGREPLYVLDGVPIDGEWASTINVNDIESVTVLKDVQAGVLYGSRASNGAIVITTKRGFRNTNQYKQGVAKYKNLEDVEYVTELKEADKKEMYSRYLQMKDSLGKEPAFYFDAAQLMFESGDKEKALRILSNLAELDNESHQLIRAMGYMLETWAMYEEAIDVYKKVLQIKEEEPQSYRDLALAYEKNGDHQQAVNILYEALIKNWFQYEDRYRGLKSLLLNEMNAIIQINHHSLDLSKINTGIIKPLPVDLRIVIDWNKDETDIDLHIVEPGGRNVFTIINSLNPGEDCQKILRKGMDRRNTS